MLTIVCSSKDIKTEVKDRYLSNIGLDSDLVEFIYYENDNKFSLSELYNKALLESKYDHIIYLHDDLTILTENWGQIMLNNFKNNPDFGIIGLAGTTKLQDTAWWLNVGFTKGIVNHIDKNGDVYETKFSEDLGEKLSRVVCVDGLFFAIDKTKIKNKFDEDFGGFHFYDLGFSLPNALNHVLIGVTTNIRVTHNSVGEVDEGWAKNKVIFENKYGKYLPVEYKISIKKEQIINAVIKERNFKSYLEVGEENGDVTLNGIDIENKMKVSNIENDITNEQKFDVIFIDGTHFSEIVECDIKQALSVINENGIVMVHDCMPSSETEQLLNTDGKNAWTGDVWKAWVKFRFNTKYLTYTYNTDFGIGIIDTSKTISDDEPLPIMLVYVGNKEYSQMRYREFDQNRDELLKLVEVNGR